MNRLKYFLPMICAALIMSGCIDTDDTFTINPDGSGKVVHIAMIPLDGMQLNFGEDLSDEEKFQNTVKDELEKAKGVDAWKDVTFAKEGESIRFEGTAYFKNLNKLKFHNSGITVGMYNELKFSEAFGLSAGFDFLGAACAGPKLKKINIKIKHKILLRPITTPFVRYSRENFKF